MNTLFFRIYLSTLAFLWVTFFVVLFIANNFVFKDLLGDSSQKMYQQISQSLATKKQESWHNEIKTYNALVTDFTLSLVTVDEITKEEKQQLLQENNGSVISDNILG